MKNLSSSVMWGGDWMVSTSTPGQPTFSPQLHEQGHAQCLAGMVSHTLDVSQASNPSKMGKADRGGTVSSFIFSHLALSLVLYL